MTDDHQNWQYRGQYRGGGGGGGVMVGLSQPPPPSQTKSPHSKANFF